MGSIDKVTVVGLGKVGSLVATLLQRAEFEVRGVDQNDTAAVDIDILTGDVSDPEVVKKAVQGSSAVVSCLPYAFNSHVARAAHEAGVHYFDLTEDVPTTKLIQELSETASAVMAPQCGLAPGFIGIVGASLTEMFDSLRSIELRVGALPQNPRGLLGYAFNWSPEGVVNEYLNDCEVVMGGEKKTIPSLGQLEAIVIDGIPLEAFTTSGGLGTMCETYAGRVDTLNYKTMRYPGHCDLMRFFFHELHMSEDRQRAGEILVNAKPPVNDDVVYVHAAVEGVQKGSLFREEFVEAYYPIEIDDKFWTAISWTTAASVCAVVEMVSNGDLPNKGFIKQEEISLAGFINTKNGSLYAEASE